ncbi:hypothetical protein Aph01nite_65250 [Acrocarpospora phusangensis]|uniref:DUF6879 domain-containing protein n=1 Tax=Acrocarpospora phusangensis TaxID=1070424 RepID=A0A919QIU7_9ACTN|nr:DUF6879 family protein [Acrocarpospora phusangensis]GIH28215.1 hypothetical protein Aph01nite_65250 [Acrocarpospora phusangensis]
MRQTRRSDDTFARIREADGVTMDRAVYRADFHGVYREMEGVLWKLERAQYFHEPYSASWVAWAEGDWDRSLALIEAAKAEYEADLPSRVELRRLRIVEHPRSPYLEWELRVLAARARAGERPRVLDADAVRHLERERPLPELLIPSPDLLYEILYDQGGAHIGGRRIADRALIEPCLTLLSALYDQAEDLPAYLTREPSPHLL